MYYIVNFHGKYEQLFFYFIYYELKILQLLLILNKFQPFNLEIAVKRLLLHYNWKIEHIQIPRRIKLLKAESQNFLDPVLSKPES